MERGLLSGTPHLSIPKHSDRVRRLVHLGFGACALLLRPLGQTPSIAMAAAAVLYNGFLAPALRWDRSYRRPGEGRWGGLFTYALAVLGLVAFTPFPEVAAGAWIVLAVADPVAAAVGTVAPRPRWLWNRSKSVVGSVAGATAGGLACGAVLAHLGVASPWAAGALGGAAGACAESLPLGRDDNLVVAAAAAVALALGT